MAGGADDGRMVRGKSFLPEVILRDVAGAVRF